MDIDDILSQASHNVKKNNKKIKEAEVELQKERDRKIAALKRQKQLEREELAKKKPPPPPPKQFKIPKKTEDKVNVDTSKIAAFLNKKEEDKRKEEEKRRKEKEELIRLRIAAQGGKANKKIAKHFGANPVNLQMKYGSGEHVDSLIKQQQREEEDIRKLSNLYKEGMEKGMSKQKQILLKQNIANLKAQQASKTVHSTPSKQKPMQSSSGSSSKHVSRVEKGSSSKIPSSSSSSKPTAVTIKRKAPPVDFTALLQKAEKNRGLSPSKLENPTPSPSPPPPPKRPSYEDARMRKPEVRMENHRDVSFEKSKYNGQISKNLPSKMPEKSYSSQNGSSSSKLSSKYDPVVQQKKSNGAVKKPEPEVQEKPMYDPNKQKRILPGDIRYQGSSTGTKPGFSASRAVLQKPTPSKPINVLKNPNKPSSSKMKEADDDIERQLAQLDAERERLLAAAKAKYQNAIPQRKPAAVPAKTDIYRKPMVASASRDQRRDSDEYNLAKIKRDERFKADQLRQMAMKKKNHSHQSHRNHHHHSYNSFVKDSSDSASEDDDYDDVDDEEYASDLADFIDDTELDDFQQVDLEETLKMINRNYDKKKWKMNEKMIDERQMTARFADIEREERRSAKLGLVEDMLEARKGKSRAI
uniref:Protein SPT2 homolog n=1 Tax=Acrobeloides nanus TaxID=290746 RepID=A0A914EI41_9BILA